MRKLLEWMGALNIVVFLMALGAASSVLLVWASYSVVGLPLDTLHLWIAALVAVIIVPVFSIPIVHQLFKISTLEDENRRLATYDQLTGLMTRNAFIGSAESYAELAKRKQSEFALLFIDIDDFKQVNDNHDHSVGDRLLTKIGDALLAIKRDSDLAGRYGGDEFVLLLPETNRIGAQSFADKIHAAISHLSIQADSVTLTTAVSIGVSIARPTHEQKTLAELIRQSDLALYQAKKIGKNSTVFYSPEAGRPDYSTNIFNTDPTLQSPGQFN